MRPPPPHRGDSETALLRRRPWGPLRPARHAAERETAGIEKAPEETDEDSEEDEDEDEDDEENEGETEDDDDDDEEEEEW